MYVIGRCLRAIACRCRKSGKCHTTNGVLHDHLHLIYTMTEDITHLDVQTCQRRLHVFLLLMSLVSLDMPT